MKLTAIVVSWLCLMLIVGCAPTETGPEARGPVFPELRGPYLGQEPPGLEPRLFAPGVVSTGLATRDVAMTPDGSELYFSVTAGGSSVIMVTRQVDGRWTEPQVAPFSGRFLDIEPAISPDGRRFFFLSTRPQAHQEPREGWVYQDIWVMDRQGDGWSEPANLGPPVNTEAPEYFPSVTADGSLYFTRERADGVSSTYRSRLVDGAYAEPELMPPQLNCGTNRANVWVAPDESFAIVPQPARGPRVVGLAVAGRPLPVLHVVAANGRGGDRPHRAPDLRAAGDVPGAGAGGLRHLVGERRHHRGAAAGDVVRPCWWFERPPAAGRARGHASSGLRISASELASIRYPSFAARLRRAGRTGAALAFRVRPRGWVTDEPGR